MVQGKKLSPTAAETQNESLAAALQFLLAWPRQKLFVVVVVVGKPVRDHVPVAALVTPIGWSVYTLLSSSDQEWEEEATKTEEVGQGTKTDLKESVP